MYLNIEEGKKIAMPRYYKDKIYNETQRARLSHLGKVTATKRNEAFEKVMYEKYGDDWTRAKAESDLAAVQKMRRDALKNRDKYEF